MVTAIMSPGQGEAGRKGGEGLEKGEREEVEDPWMDGRVDTSRAITQRWSLG